MKEYLVEVSENANHNFETIISYLRYDLAGDIIANRYKDLFTKEIAKLKYIAGSMAILDEKLTGHKKIRKINVKNYIIFYMIEEKNNKIIVTNIGHGRMNWRYHLKIE